MDFEKFIRVAEFTTTFLYDLKLIDREKRKRYLGTDSNLELDNLKKLSNIHRRIVIRIPLIPGINDTDDEFVEIIDFAENLKEIKNIHILPFHQIGASKYKTIGKVYSMVNVSEDNDERVKICADIARQRGFLVNIGGAGYA